jgi:hypothetical protein
LDKTLVEEQEKNAGQLAEIEDLQKQYDEKLAAFAVSRVMELRHRLTLPGSQEIDRCVGQGCKEVRKGTGRLGGEEETSCHQAKEVQEVSY